MDWYPLAPYLEGALLKKDIFNNAGQLLLSKETTLTTKHIERLGNSNVTSVYASLCPLHDSLFFQLEHFITSSTQPLFWESYLRTVEKTKSLFYMVRHFIYPDMNPLLEQLEETFSLLENPKEFFEMAYSVDGYEDNLYRHSVNVAISSALFLSHRGQPYEAVFHGAYLHDIGKATLDPEILFKPGKLTTSEAEYMASHPNRGKDLLPHLQMTNGYVRDVVQNHHEYPSGMGYPNKKKASQLSEGVKIVTMLDFFDSMLSDREYKNKITFPESVTELRSEVSHRRLDETLVQDWTEYLESLSLSIQ